MIFSWQIFCQKRVNFPSPDFFPMEKGDIRHNCCTNNRWHETQLLHQFFLWQRRLNQVVLHFFKTKTSELACLTKTFFFSGWTMWKHVSSDFCHRRMQWHNGSSGLYGVRCNYGNAEGMSLTCKWQCQGSTSLNYLPVQSSNPSSFKCYLVPWLFCTCNTEKRQNRQVYRKHTIIRHAAAARGPLHQLPVLAWGLCTKGEIMKCSVWKDFLQKRHLVNST